jgi:hypothetical protein
MKLSCPLLQKNEGMIDRIIRLIAGTVLLGFSALFLSGFVQTVGVLIGIALIITGAIGYCGIYTLLNISTLSKKEKRHA